MYERTTNPGRTKEREKILPAAKAPSTQRMGGHEQWYRSGPKVSDSSPNPVSLEEGPGTGGSALSEREEAASRSPDPEIGERESKAEGSLSPSNSRTDAFKKRDELGLAHRSKGVSYGPEQRQRIIGEVQLLHRTGLPKTKTLKGLGVNRSTYYEWLKERENPQRIPSPLQLMPMEKEAVIQKKQQEPQLSHRQLSGMLRPEGHWISPSSCYRILKSLGWISPSILREAPWKVSRYEPFRPNQIWGEDWTILSIEDTRHYLLTVIDYFSRYIVAWGIVRTVTRREVQNLVALAYLSEDLEASEPKPLLRADLGSPNMAHSTRRLIQDLEMVLSPSRASRPTDNSRQERWYRTVKQEEIYCYPTYPSPEIARSSLRRYIDFYNERRPHQALWNYTPGYVHRLGNKNELLADHKKMIQIVKERRFQFNQTGNSCPVIAVLN
jgi:transposase InsO family protein